MVFQPSQNFYRCKRVISLFPSASIQRPLSFPCMRLRRKLVESSAVGTAGQKSLPPCQECRPDHAARNNTSQSCRMLLNSNFHRHCHQHNRTRSCARRCSWFNSDIHRNSQWLTCQSIACAGLLNPYHITSCHESRFNARSTRCRASRLMPSQQDGRAASPLHVSRASSRLSALALSRLAGHVLVLVQVAQSRLGLQLLLDFLRLDPMASHESLSDQLSVDPLHSIRTLQRSCLDDSITHSNHNFVRTVLHSKEQTLHPTILDHVARFQVHPRRDDNSRPSTWHDATTAGPRRWRSAT